MQGPGSLGVVFEIIIASTGPGSGVFLYNGTPALGNSPIFSLTNSNQDFYGNPETPSMTLTGLPILIYSSNPPALGNLFMSFGIFNGTDIFGNPFQSGFQVWGSGKSNIELTVLGGVPRAFFSTGVPEETAGTGAVIEAQVFNAGASEFITQFLAGPRIVVPSGGQATPVLVHHTQAQANGVNSIAVTIPSTTAGNTLIVVCSAVLHGSKVATVLLGSGADNFRQDQISTDGWPSIWSDPGCAGSQTVVTINLSSPGNDDPMVDIYEFSGILVPNPLDAAPACNTVHGTGPAGTWTSNSTGAVSQTNEVIIGVFTGHNNAGTHPTVTGPSSPWVNSALILSGASLWMQSGYLITTTGGTFTYSGTDNMTAANAFYNVMCLSYKAAASATAGSYVFVSMSGEALDGSLMANLVLAYADAGGGVVHEPLQVSYNGVSIYAATVGALEPGTGTPSVAMVQEVLHALTLTNAWAGSGNAVNGFNYQLLPDGTVYIEWDLQSPNNNPGVIGTLPAAYRPATNNRNIISGWYGTGPVAYNDQFSPHFMVGTNGAITPAGIFVATIALFGTAVYHL